MTTRIALILALLFAATAALGQSADLATNVTGPATIASGTTNAYTVSYGNAGPNAATNVQLSMRVTSYSGSIFVTNMQTSNVPAGITCGSPYDTAQGPTIDCTAPTLAAAASGSITLTFTVTGTAGNIGIGTSITPTATDPNTADNSGGRAITVTVPHADLAASLTGPTPTAIPSGTTATWVSNFRNDGPDAATNARLAIRFTSLNGDVLPANMQVTSKPAAFTCSGPVASATGYTITCTTPSFASGATGQITATAQVNGTNGQLEVCNFFTSDTNDPDTNGATNGDCIVDTVAVAQADLAASTTSGSPAIVTPGTTVTYTTAFRNDGPDAATNPSLSVRFTSVSGNITPANVQVTSAPAGFTCGSAVATAQGPTITCTASSMASGASASVAMSATLNGTSGMLNVCSAFTSATNDPNTNGAPNGTCAVTSIEPAVTPTLSLTCPGTFPAGTASNATVTISIAQATNTTITLSSSNPAVASVPPSVTILAGQTSATFPVQGVSNGNATITATGPTGFGSAQTCTASVQAATPVTAVPTLGTWALIVMGALLAMIAMRRVM